MEHNLSSGDSIGVNSGGSSVGSTGSMNGRRHIDSMAMSQKSIATDIKELYRYVSFHFPLH